MHLGYQVLEIIRHFRWYQVLKSTFTLLKHSRDNQALRTVSLIPRLSTFQQVIAGFKPMILRFEGWWADPFVGQHFLSFFRFQRRPKDWWVWSQNSDQDTDRNQVWWNGATHSRHLKEGELEGKASWIKKCEDPQRIPQSSANVG